ncbi:MAG: SRPBCC domain-containing protein [Chloroflexaceae bacterium]|nr:SRPBCC domain-containing protein [Chloroflexaceae bacterium]
MSMETTRQDLVITRVFHAPVQTVWHAWSESQAVRQWWGPMGFTSPLARMDFREGGTSLVCMSSPEYGTHYSTWHYRAIVPLQSIDYLHNLADEEGHAIDPTAVGMPPDFPQNQRHLVTFTALEPHTTEITITEYDWPVGEMMELSRMGMEQCLDKMAALLVKA